MASPTRLSIRPRQLIAVLAFAFAAAACGSGPTLDTRAADSERQPDTLAFNATTNDTEPPDRVSVALGDLFNMSADAADAAAAYQSFNDAVAAAIAASSDPDEVLAAVDAAVLATYQGPQTAERADAIDQRLGGQAIDLTVSDTKQARRQTQLPGAVGDPRLKVYYVNGVNNTLDFARGTNALLVQSLGHDVTHFYNPSAFNPDTYTEAWCARSIETLFAEQRQSALLAQLQADAEAADAIAAAAADGTLGWFYEAVTRSLDGVARDVDATISNAALAEAERILGLACLEVDDIKDAFQITVEPGKFLLEWLDNTYEVAEHLVAAAIDDPSGFNPELVELIKTDIMQGRRVVIVGHSHGTMLARFALQEINRWYIQEWMGACPSGATPDPRAVAPIAGLYVSPGFTVGLDAQQAGIMVDGDFWSTIGQAANVPASGSQLDAGPIDRHDLRRYLEPGTATLAHIQGAFADLATHVTGVPDHADACDSATDDNPDSAPAESGDPTWVLVDTVVNEDGTEPHPHWKDVEVSPGHIAWTFDDGDPTFSAVYDVAYDPPPDQLEPGQNYEIPVSVSGLIVTGDSQRFTGADVILYIHRGWNGSVAVELNCVAQDGGLRCDEPVVNSGSLPFSAPTNGETFEFNVNVLNCGACEVTFRYELH